MDFFISYAREDRDFVLRLHEVLARDKHGSWVDWEDIPLTAEWLREIYAGIDAADAFVFVISPDSVRSETCRREIAHAVEHKKRIIPILRREVDSQAVPESVASLNWVPFREGDDFNLGFQKLMEAVNTDVEWLHTHTRLLVRALDWDTRSRDPSLLLRGKDLSDAEGALAAAHVSRTPAPTPLQMQYVLLSRQAAKRRIRSVIGAVGVGVSVAGVLAVLFALTRSERDVQQRRASANALAAQAQLVRDRGSNLLPLSLLLALESERIEPSAEAELLIRQTLPMLPRSIGRMAHETGVNAVSFSSDGRLLATAADQDEIVRIWDVATQRTLQELRHTGALGKWTQDLAFTPDGSQLLTCGLGGVTVWDVASGKRISVEAGATEAVSISPDGKYLALGNRDGGIVARNLDAGSEIIRGKHDIIVNAVAWSPDGRFLVSGSNDNTARIWDLTGAQVRSLPHTSGVRSVAWSPNSDSIATGGWEGIVRVWDRATGTERSRFDVKSVIHAVAFTADGARVIAGSGDQTARIWDLTSGVESTRITVGGEAQALAVSPDGRLLVTGSKDRTAALWEIGGADHALRLAHPEGIVTLVAYSPNGRRVATVSNEIVRVWELPSGREQLRLVHDGRVNAIVFSADGRSLVTVVEAVTNTSDEERITFWDLESGAQAAQSSVKYAVTAFSADGEYFATVNSKEGALVRETRTGNDVVRIANDVVGTFPSAVALDSGDRYVAASVSADAGGSSALYVWSIADGKQRCRWDGLGHIRNLTFSADGAWLAGGLSDGSARVWAIEGCRDVARVSQAAEVLGVAFSPDRKFLTTASRDQTARVWALPEATEVARLEFGGVVSSVAFSPDGSSVAAASSDRTARVWQWRLAGDLTAAVCARVGRSLTREEWRQYVGDTDYHDTCAGLTEPQPSVASSTEAARATREEATTPHPGT